MKKIFTLVSAAVLSIASMSATSLFSTTFATQEDFNAWTVIDANDDGATWKFALGSEPSNCMYQYSSANAANDWIISPEITPTKTGTVAIMYSYKGSSYTETLEVYVGNGTTVDGYTTASAQHSALDEIYNSYVLVDAVEGQAFRVAFRATTPKDRFRLFLVSVDAKHIDAAADLGVTEIVSPVTGMNLVQENVTVKIKNFASSDMSNFPVCFQLDENEPITETVTATVKAGEEIEYTFAAKADLSTPRKIYTFKAYTNVDGDLNSSNDGKEASIRHQAPAGVPYYMGFEPLEETSSISFYNLNEDSGEWSINMDGWFTKLARTGSYCLAYNYDRQNSGDDWAILEPINVEPGYYVLRFWYAATENHPEKLAVYWGNGATPADMTNKIIEYNPVNNATYKESINIVHFDKAQTVCFGFYAFSPKNENWLVIDDLAIEAVTGDNVDFAINEISAPFDFVRTGNGTDVVFELRNIGIKDAIAHAKVIIDGATSESKTLSLKAQEIQKVTFANIIAGLAIGKHSISIEVTSELDNNAANNTISKEIIVLGEPMKLWDFETGVIPEDFTYAVDDEGTINPDAGDEFNDQGWGIFKIGSTHSMLGNYVMSGTSWIDGVDNADRSVILPAVDLVNADTYLVWDAHSFNASFPEKYHVMVQDNTTSYKYFSSKYTQVAESATPVTRGISLASYAGKNVNIAFNITTANGDNLVLDNIGIYDMYVAGVEDVRVEQLQPIMISANEIQALGAKNITIVNLLGHIVATANGETIKLTDLANGVYIATVQTANGQTQSCKFVKK